MTNGLIPADADPVTFVRTALATGDTSIAVLAATREGLELAVAQVAADTDTLQRAVQDDTPPPDAIADCRWLISRRERCAQALRLLTNVTHASVRARGFHPTGEAGPNKEDP